MLESFLLSTRELLWKRIVIGSKYVLKKDASLYFIHIAYNQLGVAGACFDKEFFGRGELVDVYYWDKSAYYS